MTECEGVGWVLGGWERGKRSRRETKIEGTSRLPWVKASSVWSEGRPSIWARGSRGYSFGLCVHDKVTGLWSFWKWPWACGAPWLRAALPLGRCAVSLRKYHLGKADLAVSSTPPHPGSAPSFMPPSAPQHLCSVPSGCRGSHAATGSALQLSDQSLCFPKRCSLRP